MQVDRSEHLAAVGGLGDASRLAAPAGFWLQVATVAITVVALFALPSAWMAVMSLHFFADIDPWVDTARALGPMTEEVLSPTQSAHAGTALALWMLVALYRHLADPARGGHRVRGTDEQSMIGRGAL